MREVSGIPRVVDEAQARAVANLVMDGGIPQDAREVHYPYYWYRLRATAGTLFGESAIDLSCLVDGRTGLLATSDLLAVCGRIVPEDDVLGSVVGESDAEEAVRRYLPHVLLTGRRWLNHMNVDVRNGLLVHKPFWVMRGAAETILVDGVTGLVHPLDVPRPEIMQGITGCECPASEIRRHISSGASRLAAFLLAHIGTICSLVTPCQSGAAPEISDDESLRRDTS